MKNSQPTNSEQPFIKYVQSEYTINKGVPTES